jgi:hypothetical protein
MRRHARRVQKDISISSSRGLAENAPDLEFRKQFIWSAPSFDWQAPSVSVGLTFAADEAVAQYRIENVTSCECRN